MLTNPGEAVGKKTKESRKWARMIESFFFWIKPRVKIAEVGQATHLTLTSDARRVDANWGKMKMGILDEH